MDTPEDLRADFISKAGEFMDDYLASAKGTRELSGSGTHRAAIWDLLSHIIKQAGDKATVTLNGDDIAAKVDDVFNQVATGALTVQQGKHYMALLQSGFDIKELPALLDKLSAADDNQKR